MKRQITMFLVLCITPHLRAQDTPAAGVQWPSFRGPGARGIAENYSTPTYWDVESGKNIDWQVPIPGLGHSSPIVWGGRVFITTAISSRENPVLKVGLYGDIEPVEDQTVHEWKVYCIDKKTGEFIWERTAHRGVPMVKRHPKSTHANSTAATDGRYVVAFFGSEGLYCYDMAGTLVWNVDFGVLDAAFYLVPEAQWGFGSSPVIHDGLVIIQCDVLNDSFLAALEVDTGKEVWRVSRDEVPTWSTPTIYAHAGGTQVIVNGYKHIGAYDFHTGEELWRLSGGGDIPVPTPVVAHGLVYINSAHGRLSPIYAIKVDSKGDISLKEGQSSNNFIVWSMARGGAYMQTPLVYGEYFYNLRGNGLLNCHNAMTGEMIYSEGVARMASFSASGVAADGKLYFASEEGDVFVVKAGPQFEVLAENDMNDICMSTPAISEGRIFFRTHHYLIAVSGQ